MHFPVAHDPLAGVQLYAHNGRVYVQVWDAASVLEVFDLNGLRVAADTFKRARAMWDEPWVYHPAFIWCSTQLPKV